MRVHDAWALALVAATALAGPLAASAQAAAAPPIKQQVAVKVAPVNPVPDAGENDGSGPGPEAREAMSSPAAEVAQVMAGSLNAQYTALQPAAPLLAAAAPASQATAIPASAQFLPAVASVGAGAALPSSAAVPEPAPSAGPSVALARRVVESAEAFADYMGRASALKPDYVDGSGVARAVSAGGTYDAGQLEEGAIAYVALVALQDPEFVRSVDALGRQGYRATLVQGLAADPRAIMQMPSSAAAAARAAKALGRMGSALLASGAAVKQSAYDIQHSAWSKTPAPTAAVMLAELKAHSAVREVMAADGGEAMLATLTELRGADGDGGSGRLTPVVAQGLTLAALAVLGEAGEEHTDRVAALLNDAVSAQCLKMARLNLYQCLSVAGPSYEDVFCLGQHAMMDTAQCVAQASGWSAPARGISVPVARPVARSIMVPVALATNDAGAGPAAPGSDPEVLAPGDPNDATPPGAPPPIGGSAYLGLGGAGQR
jgi:hypothetical protein